jgi:HAMP domain-containing protein/predicted Ser/Thr protein kinase
MRLLQKILLFTGMLVVALVGGTLAFTTLQANRLASATIRQGLEETREAFQALQADRFNKLRLGVRVLANDPPFKAALVETDQATALDTMKERGRDLAADFMLATDASGRLVARTDRPAASADDLGCDPIVHRALEGEESATLWREGERLFTAVAVPMTIGPELVGTLVAGYGLDEAAAAQLRRLTHSEIAFVLEPAGQPPRVAVSSLGAREPALAAELSRTGLLSSSHEPFEVDLAGERHVGVRIPLRTAAGEEIGAALALRSVSAETAAFRQFRSSLVLVSLGVMVVALLVASAAAARITGPLRTLVGLVERVRDGSYTGAVPVHSRDEIGVLARAFNGLVRDLREKEQMITFLRDDVTALRQATAAGAAVSFAPVDAEATVTESPTVSRSGATATAALQRGQVFADRYEILGTLGKGGMGVVYRARDRQLDELVALKLLRPEALASDPSLLERFKQEIKLARRITHRNVLRTHDFGEAAGVPYISMEYVDGVTLKELVRHRGALPIAVGLASAKQMCHGLGAAHEMGVIHRDIKPQNMMILPETGELKVMDFGIARVSSVGADAGLTGAGMVMGTPDYMPPEQVQGRPADFRSDLYALSVVLYEAFTGRLPFSGDTPFAIMAAHVQQAVRAPLSLNPRLPPELDAAIRRGLEKDPARRFQSTAELLAALGLISEKVEAA